MHLVWGNLRWNLNVARRCTSTVAWNIQNNQYIHTNVLNEKEENNLKPVESMATKQPHSTT